MTSFHEMRIAYAVPIEMEDGVVQPANVFRPAESGKHPVILSYGPYAKGLAFSEGSSGDGHASSSNSRGRGGIDSRIMPQ